MGKTKKSQKGAAKEPSTTVAPAENSIATEQSHPALDYVRAWSADKKNWKFMKNRQSWILKNLYDPYKIPKEDFKLVASYIASIQGIQRTKLEEEAKTLLDTQPAVKESSTSADGDDAAASPAQAEAEAAAVLQRIRRKRAKKVVAAFKN
eukprot:m.107844 g.107844  ORF g.107844 m.107844 type:complete len:150 (+) comp16930_c0_seq2:227-676(+)